MIKITFKPMEEILAKRGLQNGGKVQLFFTNEIARRSDKYTPFLTGALKRTNRIVNGGKELWYVMPYAKRQWYRKGKIGSPRGALRGSKWSMRMWSAEGEIIKKDTAKIAGGKSV